MGGASNHAAVHFLERKEKDPMLSFMNDLIQRRKEQVMNRLVLMAEFNFLVHLCHIK